MKSTTGMQMMIRYWLFVGMSDLAFRCSWPTPVAPFDGRSTYRVKEGPWGIRKVYEYERGGLFGEPPDFADTIQDPRPMTVYVEYGVVVAFQEGAQVQKSDCDAIFSRNNRCFDFDGLESTKSSIVLLP